MVDLTFLSSTDAWCVNGGCTYNDSYAIFFMPKVEKDVSLVCKSLRRADLHRSVAR